MGSISFLPAFNQSCNVPVQFCFLFLEQNIEFINVSITRRSYVLRKGFLLPRCFHEDQLLIRFSAFVITGEKMGVQ
jgi:hypothetical protein